MFNIEFAFRKEGDSDGSILKIKIFIYQEDKQNET